MLGSRSTGDAMDCVLQDTEKSLSSLRNLRHSGPDMIGCLGSIINTAIQKRLRDPKVGCDHPVLYKGTCLACEESIGDLFGDRFDYLEQGLRVSRVARETLRKMVTRRLLGVRKLHLVLDLDHTLLQSIPPSELNPDEEQLKFYNVSKTAGDFFIDEKGRWITKLRPFVRSFLKEASAMFELTVYTAASRSYAKKMVGLLDPDRSYFGNRVIAANDSIRLGSKSLDDVLAEPSCTLILDDSKVWPDHTANLILAERYKYFDNKRRTRLHPKQPGEHGDGNYLLNVLDVLKSVHQCYFNLHNSGDRPKKPDQQNHLPYVLDVLKSVHQWCFNLYGCGDRGAADVRSQLTTLRGDVLRDCKILIPSCFDRVRRMARELGAVVHSKRCSSVTHVISRKPDAKDSRWALEKNKFLVHPDWVSAAYLQWRRPPEHEFPSKLANIV